MIKPLVVIGLAAMTCACATDPGAPDRDLAGPPPPGLPQVFVSPFGEFFQSPGGQPYPSAAWFTQADHDNDGRLSLEEFQADGQRVFLALDVNDDGVIGPEENALYEQSMELKLAGHGGGGPGRGGRPGGGGQRGGPGASLGLGEGQDDISHLPAQRDRRTAGPAVSPLSMANFLNVPQPVKAADIDTNQRITPQEWTQVGQRWFSLLDANRDGFLTLAELPRTASQRGGGRGGLR